MNPRTLRMPPRIFGYRLRAKLESRLPDRELEWVVRSLAGARAIEIGGPSSIFGAHGRVPIYPRLRSLDLVNYADTTLWDGNYRLDTPPRRSFVAEAMSLGVEDGSYDAVIASHVVEHLADPIGALREWFRVLNPGGALLLVVPHRDGTFDHRRPPTPIEHLREDAERQTPEDDLSHLEEVLRLHDSRLDPALETREGFVARCQANAKLRSLHHHVFITPIVGLMCESAGFEIVGLSARRPYNIICLACRPPADRSALNGVHFRRSPFPSDYAVR